MINLSFWWEWTVVNADVSWSCQIFMFANIYVKMNYNYIRFLMIEHHYVGITWQCRVRNWSKWTGCVQSRCSLYKGDLGHKKWDIRFINLICMCNKIIGEIDPFNYLLNRTYLLSQAVTQWKLMVLVQNCMATGLDVTCLIGFQLFFKVVLWRANYELCKIHGYLVLVN